MEKKTTYIHKDLIRIGDIIKHNGEFKTVCGCDIKESSFMGRTIFGDSFRCGYQLVEKIA